jgi:stress-induced morphogen
MNAAEVETLIKQAVPDADVQALDTTGGGDHFQVTVVAPSFEGTTMVAQHRAIYAALGDAMEGAIHALALTTLTPEQYRERFVAEL